MDTAQLCGISSLKTYFIVGLPGETDADLLGIADLLKRTQALMVGRGRDRGRVGTLHAGFNVLVPKPYTPYSREPMLTRNETRRRMRLIEKAVAGVPNIRLDRPAYRESQWQAFLSRGDCSTYRILEDAANGMSLSDLLSTHRDLVTGSVFNRVEGPPVWRFISSAPSAR